MSDQGNRAGAEARRVGADLVAPDLETALKRRRRARIATVFGSSALVAVALVGAAALLTRPETEEQPVATTTSTMIEESATTVVPAPTTSAAPANTTTTAAAPRPDDGNTVVIADDQEPPTLNPYAEGGDNFIVSLMGQAIHTGIADIDATTLERIPEVLTELPTVANGGLTVNGDGTMTVSYTIRDAAQWADGTPISGDDFAFTYESLIDPAVAGYRYQYTGNPYELIVPTSIEAGSKTFRFAMVAPTLRHEDLFEWLIPRHQVEGTNVLTDWNDVPWVSGGPFSFDSWDRGSSLTLVRNENYWKTDEAGNPLPHLDGAEFRFIPETEEIIRAFRGREVDVIQPPSFIPFLNTLASLEPEGAQLTVVNGPVWEHLAFQFGELNRNADSLNRHVDFRRAVAHALDREALVELAQEGYGSTLSSYLDVYLPDISIGAWDQYDYNPQKSRELLTGLCAALRRDCVNDPPTIVFSTTQNADLRPRIANWLVAALADVGIEVELDLEDSQVFFGGTLDRGDFDLGEWAWVGGSGYRPAVAAHDLFDPDAPPPDGSNYYRWGTGATTGQETLENCVGKPDCEVNQGPSLVIDDFTARFAEVRDLMNTTVDEVELNSLIREAEAILADQVVIIPLFSRLMSAAVWADEIGGYAFNPTQAGHTWNIEEWFRVDQ